MNHRCWQPLFQPYHGLHKIGSFAGQVDPFLWVRRQVEEVCGVCWNRRRRGRSGGLDGSCWGVSRPKGKQRNKPGRIGGIWRNPWLLYPITCSTWPLHQLPVTLSGELKEKLVRTNLRAAIGSPSSTLSMLYTTSVLCNPCQINALEKRLAKVLT